MLARPALVVEGNDALGRAAHVRHDEADAGIKFARMPFDLRDHPAWRRPASGLIAEIGMEPAHLVRRSSDRAREQIADPVLQDAVGWQPDRKLDPPRFEKLVDLGIGEAGVSPEIDARNLALISRHNGLEHSVLSIGAVNVAGTQSAAFQITELVEHEQRVIADPMGRWMATNALAE